MIEKFVMFSGGYDSTRILIEECKNSSENNPINVVTIKHNNVNADQNICEEKARKNILKILNKKYFINVIEIEEISNILPITFGWSQQFWWPVNVLKYVGQESEILFGYHIGDEFWTIEHEISKLQQISKETMRKEVKFLYPLRWETKKSIIYFFKDYEDIEKLIWYCESPKKIKGKKYIPCEECNKCDLVALNKKYLETNKKPSKQSKPIERI